MKTWKKIEETKRRANDVVKARLANEERQRRKMQQMEDERRRQEAHREQMAQMRKNRENDKQKVTNAIYLHKKEETK